jgi:PadR family transcriptional regulator, regulatory protein PadR
VAIFTVSPKTSASAKPKNRPGRTFAKTLGPFYLTCWQSTHYMLTANRYRTYAARKTMGKPPGPTVVPYGTLDLIVLKTLDVMGPLHGYRLARRIEQVVDDSFALNQGTIYPALLRLEQQGWIASKWGLTETNRRARFFSITRAGRKQLASEAKDWARTVAMMSRLLEEP